MSKIKNVIKNPKLVPLKILSCLSPCLSDKVYLSLRYRLTFGRKLNWSNPESFNEKLNWLKVYGRNPKFSMLADKYEVKKFVTKTIGSEYVVPNLGVWDRVEDIEYDKLPNQFVIKGTHDSSGAVICRDKATFDKEALADKYHPILKRNYFWGLREWPYKDIKPRIIADAFLDDNTADGRSISLRDYKFWCFNGVPLYMYCTVKDKDIYENFYDKDFHPVVINHRFRRSKPEFDKPKNFGKMWSLAGLLAKASEATFVRVDFFNVSGRIYFGEFTFYDWGGMRPFATYEQDLELGGLLNIKTI